MKKISIHKEGNSSLIGILVPIGSRDESNILKGISHFTEHMLFKGTTNRTKEQIVKEIEQYGAYFNAWTSEEHTFYYVRISNKYIHVAREVLIDMVANPLFPSEETEKEREVIVQELDMYEDNPQSYVFQLANSLIYPESSGLHLPIIGTKESLKRINSDKLREFHNENYLDPIMIEIGNVPDEHNTYEIVKPSFVEKPNKHYQTTRQTREGVNQANMVHAGTFSLNDKFNEFDISLLDAIMNGMTGRLFETIREKNNMVYSVGIYFEVFRGNHVHYSVFAGLTPERIAEAQNLMIQELVRPISKEDVDFAIKKFIGERELELDGQTFIAKAVINSVINGTSYVDELQNYVAKIEETRNRANEFVQHIDFSKGRTIALIPDNE